eukprot:53252-Pyramimonas_sp.AAC.1
MEASIAVWDAARMRVKERLKGHTGWVNSLLKVERSEIRVRAPAGSIRLVHRENIPVFPASDWSIVRIYPHSSEPTQTTQQGLLVYNNRSNRDRS